MVTMPNHSSLYHSHMVPSKNMKLLVIIILAACIMATTVKAKPIFSLKVVEVPVIVPKINILGAVGKALGIKAALIGHTLRAKANILHKVANIKGGLATLLTSSVPKELVHVTATKPVESVVIAHSPSPSYGPPPPPAEPTYGPPPPPAELSQTYGAPYPV